MESGGPTAAGRFLWRISQTTVSVMGGDRIRSADSLCECGQPFACACCFSTKGIFDSSRDGRETNQINPPAGDRKHTAVPVWRRLRLHSVHARHTNPTGFGPDKDI